MTNEERDKWFAAFRAWLTTRPVCIQKLAIEFPYGKFMCYLNAVPYYVIGWREDDLVMISPIVPWNEPREFRREAIQQSKYISATAARLGALKVVPRFAA